MTNSENYGIKAQDIIPGGAHTYSRGADQFPLNAPQVLEKGEGAYVWDLDGNKYLDYGMGLRAVTIGYAYDRVAKAAIREIWNGNTLSKPSRVEVNAAEKFLGCIEGMDMVKFAKNGSTVTTAAVKLARAYTNRKYIVRCAEHPFFSYDDWFIGDTVMDSGIPDEGKALTLRFHFNDIDTLEAVFRQYPDSIAGVIMEPATSIEPMEGFLQQVHALCGQYGAVFILDEMISGFRWDLGGAQKYYGVVPDLCTFGKGIANGFSVSALAGKREIMELGGLEHDKERVFLISTTHGAEMCGMGALMETIDVYRELSITDHLWQYGKNLIKEMNFVATTLGIQDHFHLEGAAVSPSYICLDEKKDVSSAYRTLFMQEMVRNGVLMPYLALCYMHDDTELNVTLEAAKKSLAVYRDALENGIGRYLVGRPTKPVFRKYN